MLIRDFKMPTRAVVGVIQRKNQVIIPKGNTQIFEGDNLIVFTTSENAPLIREFFKVN